MSARKNPVLEIFFFRTSENVKKKFSFLLVGLDEKSDQKQGWWCVFKGWVNNIDGAKCGERRLPRATEEPKREKCTPAPKI